MWLYFVQGVVLALPTIIVPSPLKIFLISRALAHGWRVTLPAALAPLVTDGPIVVVSLVVLNQVPAWYLGLLRVLGGLFILYLAARIFRLLKTEEPTLKASAQATQQSFRQALGVNVLNPNPYLLWSLVAGPIVLQAWRQVSLLAGLSFILGFYIIFVLGLVTMVLVFGILGRISANANKALNVIAAVFLAILGLYQLYAGLKALLL